MFQKALVGGYLISGILVVACGGCVRKQILPRHKPHSFNQYQLLLQVKGLR
jgi:hypothetical protein